MRKDFPKKVKSMKLNARMIYKKMVNVLKKVKDLPKIEEHYFQKREQYVTKKITNMSGLIILKYWSNRIMVENHLESSQTMISINCKYIFLFILTF